MKEFENKQVALLYSCDLDIEQFYCSIIKGVVIGELSQYSEGEYAFASIKRLKFLWAGPEKYKKYTKFERWEGSFKIKGPYLSGRRGLTFVNPKWLYSEDKLPQLVSKFNKQQKLIFKVTFAIHAEAFLAEP